MKLRLGDSQRKAIGARLREIRQFNNLEQTELAGQAGLSQAIISQYEKGLTEPSLSFITFLAENFGVSGDWLILGSGGSSPGQEGQEIAFRIAESIENEDEPETGGFCGVPLVDAETAAMPGKVQKDLVTDWEIVRLKEITGRANLVALDVQPCWVENMTPPLRPGCRVIINRDCRKVKPNWYYAVNAKGGKGSPRDARVNAIRRLNLTGNRLWLVEDQPKQEFAYIDLKSPDRTSDVIVGRVIWIWQKV